MKIQTVLLTAVLLSCVSAYGGEPGRMMARLQHVKAELNLSSTQEAQWNKAIERARAAKETNQLNRQQIRTAVQAELAKPAPDLRALAALKDNFRQQRASLHQAVREEWLLLYDLLSPTQKALVKEKMQHRLARMERFKHQRD